MKAEERSSRANADLSKKRISEMYVGYLSGKNRGAPFHVTRSDANRFPFGNRLRVTNNLKFLIHYYQHVYDRFKDERS